MTTVPGAVIAVGGPGTYPLPYPANAPGSARWTQLKLENATAYGLTVYFDGSPVHSVPAGVADVFSLTRGPYGPDSPPSAALTPVAPQLAVATVSEPEWGDTPGTIRPSFAEYGDIFPGAYPLALPGQAGPLAVVTTPYLPYTAAAASGASSPFFGAPAAGNFWEIATMGLVVVQPGTTTLGYLSIRGSASHPSFLLLMVQPTAPYNVGSLFSAAKFTVNEGLELFNNGVTITPTNAANGIVVARQVPVTFAPT
jgi:hypothetical protein